MTDLSPSPSGLKEYRKKIIVQKETVFRGNWNATIVTTSGFGKAQYLPTPKPIIKGSPPKRLKKEEDQEAKSPAAPTSKRLLKAPEGRPVKFSILDREKDFRAWIEEDGSCFNNMNELIGFINFEDKSAGSVDEMMLGYIQESKFDNVATMFDNDDTVIARIDLGTHVIKNPEGASVVDIEAGGIVKHGGNGTFLGQFVGARGFHSMRDIAVYMVCIDPGMCSDVSG